MRLTVALSLADPGFIIHFNAFKPPRTKHFGVVFLGQSTNLTLLGWEGVPISYLNTHHSQLYPTGQVCFLLHSLSSLSSLPFSLLCCSWCSTSPEKESPGGQDGVEGPLERRLTGGMQGRYGHFFGMLMHRWRSASAGSGCAVTHRDRQPVTHGQVLRDPPWEMALICSSEDGEAGGKVDPPPNHPSLQPRPPSCAHR